MKQNLITDVIQGMLPYLNNAQTERLQEVLQHTLFDYEVKSRRMKPLKIYCIFWTIFQLFQNYNGIIIFTNSKGQIKEGTGVVELLDLTATSADFTEKDRKSNTPKHTMSRNGRIFPQSSQHEYAEGVEFEVYPSADTTAPNYRCEIWVAVNEKAK